MRSKWILAIGFFALVSMSVGTVAADETLAGIHRPLSQLSFDSEGSNWAKHTARSKLYSQEKIAKPFRDTSLETNVVREGELKVFNTSQLLAQLDGDEAEAQVAVTVVNTARQMKILSQLKR